MTANLRTAMLAMKSHFLQLGIFEGGVAIGEPFRPPESAHMAIFRGPQDTIPETTLQSPVERRQVTCRIYDKWMQEPPEDRELFLDEIVEKAKTSLFEDFQLGGEGAGVRSIEMVDNVVDWGYQVVGSDAGVIYRIASWTIGITIDDSSTFAP